MSRAASQEHRQELKQRRAEEAEALFYNALDAFREGDDPASDRLLKRALNLCPDHARALILLSQIHGKAGHFAEALAYVLHARKLVDEPVATYNSAVFYRELGQREKAIETMEEFLAATKTVRAPAIRNLRPSALAFVAAERTFAAAAAERKQPAPAAEPPAPPPKPPERPRAAVHFLPVSLPPFARAGTLADFFLRREWVGLRLAQNFEDLLCLPSLEGVDSYIYQHETVRRVLRHFKGRALLADEVGLGKTIEACLVLKEYSVRGLVKKALVLTPPSLVSQWKSELSDKFGFSPVSPEGAEFRQAPEAFWKGHPLVVASIAMARLDPHADMIASVPWDMVIVDEAHCLKSRTSANWRLVDSLQKKFILMLTATPVENNLIELYNLITLLKPGLLATEADFRKKYVTAGKPKSPKNPDELRALLGDVMIRNTRAAADVQLPHRIAASMTVPPSEAEAQMYELVSRFVAGRYRTARRALMSQQALDLMQRQAGSSPAALRRSVVHALSENNWGRPDKRELEAILEVAHEIEESSKAEQLGRMLEARPGKAVVFTEFIPTLEHLRRMCDMHGISYALFSGELSRADKDAAISRFRDHAQVLLSTGAGGEGRNLQFADTIVNFDLPWNPMRIEQRVGRVHRIGQSRDVFVFNFCQQGTVEEQLLRVLHDKVNMFELVVGEIDAILGTLEDTRDFAEIVMDLWVSGHESGEVDREFEALAARLLDAKKQHAKAEALDDSLFARDFEV